MHFLIQDLTWKDISVQANRMPDPHHGSRLLFPSAHFYPLYLSKLVRVEVTNNGQDFTDSGIVFLYQRDAEVTGVTPNVGQDTGATSLFVSGTHFVNTTSLRCRIGPNVAPATFITSELVLCFAPPFSTMQTNMQLHVCVFLPCLETWKFCPASERLKQSQEISRCKKKNLS